MDTIRKRRVLFIILSAALMFMVLAFCKPVNAQAITKPHKTKGEIIVKPNIQYGELPYFNNNKIQRKIGGLSYDQKTNTLTINRFVGKRGFIYARNMGDLKIVVKGTCKLGHIYHVDNIGYNNTLTITGSGKLILRDSATNIKCEGKNASITLGKNVKLDASASGALQKPMVVIRKGKVASNKAIKISGNHSKSSIKISKWANSNYGSAYWYEWDKTSFTKNGKAGSGSSGSSGSSSSSSSKKPAKVTGTKGTSPSKGEVKFSWKALGKNYTGYEVWSSYYKNFDLAAKHNTAKSATSVTSIIPSGKTIYFKVRGIYKKNGKTVKGPWSSVVAIKAK